MCTVSIVPSADGFRLVSNRDERRDRAVALHPRVERLGARLAVMPIDPVGGGSWIGANDAGLVAAVLNRHDAIPARTFESRGALVRRALECGSLDAAADAVRAMEADRFRPFRLILVQGRRVAMVAGNGRELAGADSLLTEPRLFTASSLGDLFVEGPRRRLFECLIGNMDDPLDGQRLFHRHQWTGNREISVLMERGDAATVSRTSVDVSERGIALDYESLIPANAPQHVELPVC